MFVSIGVLAFNEENSIEATLDSLFQQSIFHRADDVAQNIETIVVANGCTDRTQEKAQAAVSKFTVKRQTALRKTNCQVINVRERGKANAWNLFVHKFSNSDADYLFLMDADILFAAEGTMWSMLMALQKDPFAQVSTDTPIKYFERGQIPWWARWISVGTSKMTQAGTAQLTGQLYCIRSAIARRLRLPYGLLSEDGFLKKLVCTDLLTRPSDPRRIVRADKASHFFEGYSSMKDILNNQTRYKISETINYFLCEKVLPQLTEMERNEFALTIEQRETLDRCWWFESFVTYIDSRMGFWGIFPDALTYRFKRLSLLKGREKLTYFPVAVAGAFVDVITCYRAYRALKRRNIAFWPDTKNEFLGRSQSTSP